MDGEDLFDPEAQQPLADRRGGSLSVASTWCCETLKHSLLLPAQSMYAVRSLSEKKLVPDTVDAVGSVGQ